MRYYTRHSIDDIQQRLVGKKTKTKPYVADNYDGIQKS